MPAIRYFKISFVQVYNFFVVLNSYYFLIISGCEQKSAIKSDIEQQTESTANAASTTSSFSAVPTTEVPTTVEKTTPTSE